jgi:hypothetical protein
MPADQQQQPVAAIEIAAVEGDVRAMDLAFAA